MRRMITGCCICEMRKEGDFAVTKMTRATLTVPAADLGPLNPLPDLKGAGDAHAAIPIDTETVSEEEARYMGWGRVHTILPYLLQDGYGRERRETALESIEMENDHLKAIFLPSLGGRLWSLTDKENQRELLYRNPVFQPANLALRNAWFSGGVEWNCGIIGHTPFTCDDLSCECLGMKDGTPVLRMFAYERVRHLFYRVEACLPEGARQLYVRIRIDNARKERTAVYWWSNMAVPEGENLRVLVPAEKAFRYGYGGKLSKVPIPYMDAEADKLHGDAVRMAREQGGILHWDVSRPTCLPQSMDFFFDVPGDVRPFIAEADEKGEGIVQTSTKELRGRKLFAWGMGTGGRHWQTFLSEPGSAYIELQSGLAHTQLEHLPMDAGASISWLEAYGPLRADAAKVQGKDWEQAVAEAARALDRLGTDEELEEMHRRMKAELDGRRGTVLHRSEGYALCEKALLGEAFETFGLSAEAMEETEEVRRWTGLAQNGDFPCPSPTECPGSYQISPEWEKRLQAAADRGTADHWFAHYHLGVMAHARADFEKARAEYRRSLEKAENPWALRCLALLEGADGTGLLLRAAEMKPIRALALEAMEALMETKQYEEILRFHDTIPEALQADGRVRTYRAAALLRGGQPEAAEALLRGNLVLSDVREGNTLLTDLWFELAALREFGRVDEDGLAWARNHVKPPEHLDFRMH